MDLLISIPAWLIGVSLMIIFFPVSLLLWVVTWPFDRERVLMHWWLVIQGNIIIWLIPLWKIKAEGRAKAVKGKAYVIISNHQSMLDVMILNRLCYKLRWISKIENYQVPVIGWYLRMAKYITIDRGNKDSKAIMMGISAGSLRKGISIMIFPEGTRSLNGEIGPFKLGAFELAMMTDKPVLPVVLDGTGNVLPKNGVVMSGGHKLKIRVLDPVYPWEFGTADPGQLAVKFHKLLSDELMKMRNGL
jgi:1-acyl-sn-glycerol-3-phosphate acyltransferase